jgi:hypothetical protein
MARRRRAAGGRHGDGLPHPARRDRRRRPPRWRASAVGVYRLWRDAGFAIGALLAGAVADLAGLGAAIWTVTALTAASGAVVAVRMYETHPAATGSA